MSYAERHAVTIVTDTSGNGTGYTPVITGRIMQIIYSKPGTGGYSNGVDFTITLEATGETVWTEENVNASTWRAPRLATHTTSGVAAVYIAAGQAVLDHVVCAQDRVKIAIASGGSVLTGTFYVIVG